MTSPRTSKPRMWSTLWRGATVLLLFGGLAGLEAADWRMRSAVARSLMPHFLAQGLAVDALRPEERAFLDKALEQSGHEMRLARLAIAQANSSDLRTFAQQLAADQQQIVHSISSLRRKKGSTATEGAPEIVPDSYQQLTQLTGHGFDQALVRVLAETHRALLTLFEEVTDGAKDLEVRDLAGGALPILRQHRNRITELTKELE